MDEATQNGYWGSMTISELHTKVAHLERELQEARDLLAQATHDRGP